MLVGLRPADRRSVDGVGNGHFEGFAEFPDGIGAEVALACFVLRNSGRADPGKVSELGLGDAAQCANRPQFLTCKHGGHCGSPVVFGGVR